ncbi:transmembrane protease serine 9-like [Porites lutea]|uniref:transmembrane protease serine 9-like n=1 Tax=Porites lutea TaxID=51062 RepID=UPI003CC60754
MLTTGILFLSLWAVSSAQGLLCGRKGKPRIVGGSAAEENEWPWQALLMDKRKNQFCGGSLIDSQWVLTAAHCIDGESTKTVQVRLGSHKRKQQKPNGIVQDFKVIQIIKHWKYNKRTQSNDVALLKLDRKAKLSREVNLVCLPESVPDPSHGQKCWTTGWGTTASGGSQPDVLHEVEVPAVSHAICNQAYKGKIDKTMICAGLKQGGKDACQGDSGGPFVCGVGNGNNERFYLHGVTSWGYGCADPDAYGVYAKVSVFMKWIKKRMGKPQKPRPTMAPSSTVQPPASPSTPSGARVCGKGPDSRIVGGTAAKHGDYPWQALLQTAKTSRQFCGGTLVHPEWVVTAAHCVEGSKSRDIIVRMGAHNRVESKPPNAKEQRFKLLKIIKHPSYHKPIDMSHDIALLKLERPAILDSYTNLACLPSSDPVVGDSCVITGWGTLASGGSQPDKLQVATVPVVRQSTCEKAYKQYGIHASMICAGLTEGGVDSCQGDSGGPMVCKDASGLYSLHGVTSWGVGCADKGKYGVYARVKYLLTWINKQISSN